jgi:hypothetical protein
MTEIMTREAFYAELVYNLSEEDFTRMFGCRPHDIMDFDYDFNTVKWNMALECAYNDYINNM